MPSQFETAWSKSSTAIDDRFGARFLYQPMRRVSGKRSIFDDTRQPTEITAALDPHGVILPLKGKRLADNTVSEEDTTTLAIDISRAALSYRCVIGDTLTRLETGELFEVSGVLDDRIARIVLRCFKRAGL